MQLTGTLFENAGRSVPQDRLAGTCVLSDEQSFSSGGRDAQRQPGRRHEMVFGHLHVPVQSSAQALRASVQRPLQVVDRGRQRQGIFADGVRLRAFESGAGQVAGTGRPAAGLSLEQLWRILEKSTPASELAADGPSAGRNGHSQRQRRRAKALVNTKNRPVSYTGATAKENPFRF